MKSLILLLAVCLVGKVSTECNGKPVHAACYIEPGQDSNVTGTIDFRQKMTFGCFASGSMEILMDLKGFQQGSNLDHGIQVKTYGDTSNGCATTGYTYSADVGHGTQMLGDLGTLQQDGEGNMYTMIKNKKAKLAGPLSVIGRAVVVYDGAFNPFSQNPINAPILGCCVIGYSDGSRWTSSRNSVVTNGSSRPIETGMRSGIRHVAPPRHPSAPHPKSKLQQKPSTFHSQKPVMSSYHQKPRQEFGNDFGLGGHDSIFGGSPISHRQPVFSFGGSSHDHAHKRFNRGGGLGPHIPDFDKAQSTPIYKRREGDIRSPLFGADPKPLFDNSHSSFFPSFDQDTSFKNEKNDVIHSKDQDDEQASDSNGQYYDDSGRQGAAYDDGQYGHQHGRSESDQGSDRASSDSGSYDGSDTSNYQGDSSGSSDDYNGNGGGSSSSSSSSSGSSDGGSSNDYQDGQENSQGQEQYQGDEQTDSQDQASSQGQDQAQYEGDSNDQKADQQEYQDSNNQQGDQQEYQDSNDQQGDQQEYQDSNDQQGDQQEYQDSNDQQGDQQEYQDSNDQQGDQQDYQDSNDQQGDQQDYQADSAGDSQDSETGAANTVEAPAAQEQQPIANQVPAAYQPETPQQASSDKTPAQSSGISSAPAICSTTACSTGKIVAPIPKLPAGDHLDHQGHTSLPVVETQAISHSGIVSPIDHANHVDHIAAQIVPQHIDHGGILHPNTPAVPINKVVNAPVPGAQSVGTAPK